MQLERSLLFTDSTLTGARWCARYSAIVDEWLASLLTAAVGSEVSGVSLVAVGGYGRSELCPQSDLDLMLLRSPRREVTAVSERVWYPIWDAGLKLGHSLCTQREALDIAEEDLDTATALLSARHIAGDASLTIGLRTAARSQWERRSKRWLEALDGRVEARHAQAGEVAFMLEPDLKEGRGGLRDVQSLHWAQAARAILVEHDDRHLTSAYDTLLAARVELQRRTDRPSNLLAVQEQDGVAAALGYVDSDALMADIASAARTIAWTSDDAWRRVRSSLRGPLGRVARRDRTLAEGIVLRDHEVRLAADADPAADPLLALRSAAVAAAHAVGIARDALELLAQRALPLPDPWPPGAHELLVRLLLEGVNAIPVIEALDHRGIWTRILPEWEPVRSLPQRNTYHRFTVDRHLLEATANAAGAAGRVDRPDLLVMSALLHDLGKGTADDHTIAGVELARRVATRIGFHQHDVDTLAELVGNHLLLSEVAVRRDLDDPATIQRVAERVSSIETLQLLSALTEADSRATGPAAWGPAKARLVALLVQRVESLMSGNEVEETPLPEFPSRAQRALIDAGGTQIACAPQVLTVVTDDRPGIFCKVAGVLAFHGLDVVSATAFSVDGRALSEFGVSDPFRTETPWPSVERDLALALSGRLAVHARVADRARTYNNRQPRVWRASITQVRFDNAASNAATVIDVHTIDGVGVLYNITRALTEFDVDIRSARVQTLGTQVVDAFYVVDRAGCKITDASTESEIERAIIQALKH
ncbi:MAG TPA: [protein-PII] uridylyltransferase [Acidimicrobiia bacterium]|nr:[protein-PII] uridylyltransferase [Acidimicrobiia bacterium]